MCLHQRHYCFYSRRSRLSKIRPVCLCGGGEEGKEREEEIKDTLVLSVSSCERSSSVSLNGIKLKVSGRSSRPAPPCLMFWMTGSVCLNAATARSTKSALTQVGSCLAVGGDHLGEIPAEVGQPWVSSLSRSLYPYYCGKKAKYWPLLWLRRQTLVLLCGSLLSFHLFHQI